MTQFFQNEKLSVAHPTAAWASQSGKGLLFFAKQAEDKASPLGIINLVSLRLNHQKPKETTCCEYILTDRLQTDISEVSKEGSLEVLFKVNGQKHVFQANNALERDGWLAAFDAKSAEGKAEKETIVNSEGYKTELDKMSMLPSQ